MATATDAPETTPPAAPAREAKPWTGEVVIELADNKNSVTFQWQPTKSMHRGARRKMYCLPHELTQETTPMPDTPGIYIRINGHRRILQIFDPLGLDKPEMKELLAEINIAWKNMGGTTQVGPEQTYTINEATDTQVKTWLYFADLQLKGSPLIREARKKDDGGPQAIVVSGKMPERKEIMALPGKIRIQQHNSSSHKDTIRFFEDADALFEISK